VFIKMLYIATTRFNDATWQQNNSWRERHEWDGCIYGSPTLIKETIPIGMNVAILEMHNDLNTIMGIGIISNNIEKEKKYQLYEWGNYNRFIYKSLYRIDRGMLDEEELKIITILETLVFKGSRHLKRGHGITVLPEWIIKNKHISFEERMRQMFLLRFKTQEVN
jgi:hypothetical protein